MWFPELFSRFDQFANAHENQSASVCEVIDFVINNGSHQVGMPCNDTIGNEVFRDSLITVASAIPSNIVAVLFMDLLGRKFFLGTYVQMVPFELKQDSFLLHQLTIGS